MTYRLRQILPPRWALTAFALVYLFVEALGWCAFGIAGPMLILRGELLKVQQGLVLIGCALYALYRALAYHPVCRPAYLKWLKIR